jgi:uncharacterized membrane protein
LKCENIGELKMSNLVALAFDTETGAEQMRDELIQLQKEHIIALDDAAVAIKDKDGKVKVKQVTSLAGAGALIILFPGV